MSKFFFNHGEEYQLRIGQKVLDFRYLIVSKIQNFLPHGDNYYFRIGQKGLDFGHLRASKFENFRQPW